MTPPRRTAARAPCTHLLQLTKVWIVLHPLSAQPVQRRLLCSAWCPQPHTPVRQSDDWSVGRRRRHRRRRHRRQPARQRSWQRQSCRCDCCLAAAVEHGAGRAGREQEAHMSGASGSTCERRQRRRPPPGSPALQRGWQVCSRHLEHSRRGHCSRGSRGSREARVGCRRSC